MADTLVPAAPSSDIASAENPFSTGRPGLRWDWALGLTAAVALLFAVIAYLHFLDHPRHLWDRGTHDRNFHHMTGLQFGLSMKTLDVPFFLQTLDRQRVWGILHGLLVGAVTVVAGPDYRLAVLPSLIGWIGSVLLAFLIARRLAPRGGDAAGLLAAVFVLTSPGHQAFATDVMLESLGACLSLLVLHRYLVAVQDPSRRAFQLLGLALSLLFFLKANYWLLATVSLAVAEAVRRPSFYWDQARGLALVPWSAWLRGQLRHPLTYVLLPLTAVLAWVMIQGEGTLQIGGRTISISSPHNLLNVIYTILFIRAVLWWRRVGRTWVAGLGMDFLALAYWHVLPVALYFLLPKRVGYFLWFVSPANSDRSTLSFWEAFQLYWPWASAEYHYAGWTFLLALGLAAVAGLAVRTWRPGTAAVACFILLSLVLTVKHPNRKPRYLHSWIAAGWTMAGAGLACLAFGQWTRHGSRTRALAGGASVAALAGVTLPAFLQPHQVSDGGPQLHRPSILALSDSYLPELADARHALVLSNDSYNYFCQWTYLERYGKLRGIDTDIRGFRDDVDANRTLFTSWMNKKPYQAVVFLDIPKDSIFYESVKGPAYEQVLQFLREDSRFEEARQWHLTDVGCTIHLWRPRGYARSGTD